jgi:hypothetical protein
MASLNFVKGSIKGRVGQFVGSSWKGIDYIKTYTPPGNPRTEGAGNDTDYLSALRSYRQSDQRGRPEALYVP